MITPYPNHLIPVTPHLNTQTSFDSSSLNTYFTSSQSQSPVLSSSLPHQSSPTKLSKTIKSKRLSRTFHDNFHELKRKMNVQNTRKTNIDSLLKKIKSKCLKATHEILKNCLNLIVCRLPQNFITNIKIELNKYYLNKTIGEIYYDFNLLLSYSDIHEKNLIRKGKHELFNDIYSMRLKQVYNTYLESNLFKKDYENIKLRDGEKFAELYKYVAKNMCEYYLLSKGNKRKNVNNQRLMDEKIYNNLLLNTQAEQLLVENESKKKLVFIINNY